MPMHGEFRIFKIHGETATKVNVKPHNVFVVANGDQIELHLKYCESNNHRYCLIKDINNLPSKLESKEDKTCI